MPFPPTSEEEWPGLDPKKPLGFDDLHAAYNMREWFQGALKAAGAEVSGAGMGMGEADVSIRLDGYEYWCTIKPVKK